MVDGLRKSTGLKAMRMRPRSRVLVEKSIDMSIVLRHCSHPTLVSLLLHHGSCMHEREEKGRDTLSTIQTGAKNSSHSVGQRRDMVDENMVDGS